jgi:ribonuclease Z
MFNCGEGTQRLAYEHKVKLAKLEHLFFTKSSWKNLGGLPGLCLTLRDAGVSSVTLHGPNQIVWLKYLISLIY